MSHYAPADGWAPVVSGPSPRPAPGSPHNQNIFNIRIASYNQTHLGKLDSFEIVKSSN